VFKLSERKEDITHIRVSVEQKEMLQKIKEIEGLRSLRKGLQKLIQDSDYTNKFKRIDRSFNRMLEEVPEGKKEKKKDKFELIRSLTKQVIRIDDPEKYREKTGYIPESYKKLFLEEKKEDTEPQTKEGENLMKANPKEKREEVNKEFEGGSR